MPCVCGYLGCHGFPPAIVNDYHTGLLWLLLVLFFVFILRMQSNSMRDWRQSFLYEVSIILDFLNLSLSDSTFCSSVALKKAFSVTKRLEAPDRKETVKPKEKKKQKQL